MMIKTTGPRKSFTPGLLLVSGILIGALLTRLYYVVYSELFPSTDMGANFVKTCAELNGHQLNFENLNKLNGKVYVSYKRENELDSVGLEPLNQEHVNQYLHSFKEPIDKKSIGIDTKTVNYRLVIYDNSFDVSRGKLAGDWRCNVEINQKSQVITSTPYFQPE